MKIRILMVGPGEGVIGGIATVTKTLIPILKQRTNLLYVPTTQWRLHKMEAGKLSRRNVTSAVSQYTRFLTSVRSFRPQVIHIHTSEGGGWLKDTFFVLAARLYQIPVIVHIHAADFDHLYNGRPLLEQHYTRTVMRLADRIITVSEQWRNYLSTIVPDDRIFAFRNCIAVDEIKHYPSQRSDNGIKALFLGSIGTRKGVFDLLNAMRQLKSAGYFLNLWIAGYEEREGDIARAHTQIEQLQLQDMCQLVGLVQGAEKVQLLHEANLFVLPSYNEGLPIAVLEAMAAGLAIVATPVGGIPEVIRDGYNGFLVTPGDVETLVKKLVTLNNDQDLRKIMGKRNRQIAEEELDIKPYTNRLVSLYESLTLKGVSA